MGNPHAYKIAVIPAITMLLSAAGGAWAQDALTVTLHPSGMIQIGSGQTEPAMVELNAHGPNWQHAPQETATAEVSDLPGQTGKRIVGTLPIPNTDGGALAYTQSVKTLPQGLLLAYDLSVPKPVKLNGLQLSILLPVARYAGKELVVRRHGADPQIAGFPEKQSERSFQVWSGEGARVEIAGGTPEAFTVELRAATDTVVQDLRQWEREIFEIRFPAIMEDQGRELAVGDRFHLDLTLTFAAPVKLTGP